MGLHPDCAADWRAAKRSAFALAAAAHLTVGQSKSGRPVLYRPGRPPEEWPTWLALATWLHRLRQDQTGIR